MEFPARILDAALRLLLLPGIHLRQGGAEPAADTLQQGDGHVQIPLQRHSRQVRFHLRWLLCSQEQLRLLENAVAHDAGPFAPRRIKSCCLPGVTMMLHPTGGHSFAILGADARDRNQILHRELCRNRPLANVLLNCCW